MNPVVTFPSWVFWLLGGLVAAFGLFRLRLGFRSAEAEEEATRKGGLYGRGRRIHLLYGAIYIALGGMLIATGMGMKMPWMP